jgi:D-alanyl-D-alanine dipeptidase
MKNYILILCLFVFPLMALQQAELVEIQKINPDIIINLIWATGDNELGLVLYPDGARCYLHKEAAYALDSVQKELKARGYGLKVLEAFRPLWAQKIVWDRVGFNPPTENFGRHTLGTAVDVTLVNLKDGSSVALPSQVSREADIDFVEFLTPEHYHNLEILKQVMERNSFMQHDTEWFHFDYTGWEAFKALD